MAMASQSGCGQVGGPQRLARPDESRWYTTVMHVLQANDCANGLLCTPTGGDAAGWCGRLACTHPHAHTPDVENNQLVPAPARQREANKPIKP